MRPRKRRSPRRPGYTISQFAALPEVDQTPSVIRNAVRNGQIRALSFNGILCIPPIEKDRYLATWGTAGPNGVELVPGDEHRDQWHQLFRS
jgi:hypothetical protein